LLSVPKGLLASDVRSVVTPFMFHYLRYSDLSAFRRQSSLYVCDGRSFRLEYLVGVVAGGVWAVAWDRHLLNRSEDRVQYVVNIQGPNLTQVFSA
jgi:hypothetical protein